jgi:hypothetical protein
MLWPYRGQASSHRFHGVHNTCGSGLARDEAFKNAQHLDQPFFCTKMKPVSEVENNE